jgi:dihydrofolate reductase
MRKLIATEFVTLDGVMEAPGTEESLGALGGWSFLHWNDEAGQYKFDELFATGALLLGRVTYQIFAAAWPTITDEKGFADRMNRLPKYVVSTSLDRAEWNNSTLIKANVPEEIARLKQQDGQDILLHGSADLVQTLRQHDLIDEYRLMVFPVILGVGKRLFPDGGKTPLKLVDSKTFSTGVVVLTYRPERKA